MIIFTRAVSLIAQFSFISMFYGTHVEEDIMGYDIQQSLYKTKSLYLVYRTTCLQNFFLYIYLFVNSSTIYEIASKEQPVHEVDLSRVFVACKAERNLRSRQEYLGSCKQSLSAAARDCVTQPLAHYSLSRSERMTIGHCDHK